MDLSQFKLEPDLGEFWLTNAHAPSQLLPAGDWLTNPEGFTLVDVQVQDGQITRVQSASGISGIDLAQGIILPCFVDVHTHLDKSHVANRAPNLDRTFMGAIAAIKQDSLRHWQPDDLYRRMEFALKCSYAHGTQAIRTHLDTHADQAEITFQVFSQLQKTWGDRLDLQAVSLVEIDYYQTAQGAKLADLVAYYGQVLGCVAFPHPEIDRQLDTLFQLAQERGLELDIHADETLDPDSQILVHIAQAAERHNFTNQITCGHCCSLASQSALEVAEALRLAKQVGMHIVSLPMCNLFLQDRRFLETPRQRGVTLIQELHQQGIPVAVASDNCRDPFFAFGDHDMLEVFSQAVRIAHLDNIYPAVPAMVTSTPAQFMGLPKGLIQPGMGADLIVFRGRKYSELLSRPQSDRLVLRAGRPIDTTLPDYRELDDLLDG